MDSYYPHPLSDLIEYLRARLVALSEKQKDLVGIDDINEIIFPLLDQLTSTHCHDMQSANKYVEEQIEKVDVFIKNSKIKNAY